MSKIGTSHKIDEAELIAYHLRELSPLRQRAVRRALESDAELAAESEAIAETLRAFGGEGASPVVDEAVLERSWQRVWPSLAVFTPQPRRWNWRWPVAVGSGLAVLAVAIVIASVRIQRVPMTANSMAAQQPVQVLSSPPAESAVLEELHTARGTTRRYNNRPGPLTTAPVNVAANDPAIAAHLDSAERLLTEVSHEDGPLPAEARTEAHHLLLENALYRQTAQSRGDYAAAGVMDDLGRVLISLDAEPPRSAQSADSFRLQMNVGGVLFDLRILHRSQSSASKAAE